MDDQNKTFPEAKGIAYTTYRRTDGFEVSLTIRDVNGKTTLERLDAAITEIKASGASPIPLRGSFTKGTDKRPIEYIEGRVCPVDGAKLIKPMVGSKAPIKCSNGRWNSQTKQQEGCQFVEWPQSQQVAPFYGQSRGRNDEQDYGY